MARRCLRAGQLSELDLRTQSLKIKRPETGSLGRVKSKAFKALVSRVACLQSGEHGYKARSPSPFGKVQKENLLDD